MSKKIFGLIMVMFLAVGVTMAANTADVDVYVTPGGITATLTSPTSFYNFGIVDVQTSSISLTAVTLHNDSAGGVTLEKTIEAINNGGTIVLTNDSPGGTGDNKFRLRCVEKATVATIDTDFDTSYSTFSTTTGGAAYTDLTNTSGVQVSLGPKDSATDDCNIWFQIDMPDQVDNQDERKFDLTYKATLQ